MRNSRVNEELFSANYGRVPGALPSPAAVKPLPFSYASPAFSSFNGSPSPLQQGVDCNLAYWQSLQKQQTNKELPGSQPSHLPVQYPGFKVQNSRDPPGSQPSHMPVQYPGFNVQTNRDPPGSQRSHMPVQYTGFFGQTNRNPPGNQHSHMPVQYPGFIGQTNSDPPGNQHSHMPVQYRRFIGQTNKDPPGSQPSHMPVKYPGFIEPQLKQLLNLQSSMGPPSHHSQLPQQLLGFTKDQLESLRWQQYMETPLSNDTQLHPQHASFTEHPLKRGGQFNQEPHTPVSIESQPPRSFLHAPLTFNQNKAAAKHVQDVSEKPQPISSSGPGNNLLKTSYKGKEKVTSSSANMQTCTSVMNEPQGHGFPGNRGLLNTSYPFVPPKESYYPRLPLEFRQALEGCSPLGAATIPDPYGETDEVMFDIPFFRNTRSTNLSGSIRNSSSLSMASNMKDPPPRKGKEAVNVKKRRRKD